MFLNTNPFIKNATYIGIDVTNVHNPYIYNSYLFEIDRDRL